MSIECNYSFEMLYKAAHGKNLPLEEKIKLQSFAQDKINLLVEKWAKIAGWKIQSKKGSDNKTYIAFYASQNQKK